MLACSTNLLERIVEGLVFSPKTRTMTTQARERRHNNSPPSPAEGHEAVKVAQKKKVWCKSTRQMKSLDFSMKSRVPMYRIRTVISDFCKARKKKPLPCAIFQTFRSTVKHLSNYCKTSCLKCPTFFKRK